MAKQKGPIKLSGKLGDVIHVKDGKKSYTKMASDKKMKNTSPQFNAEKDRTKVINRLSSPINNIFRHSGGKIKADRFYHNLGSKFREALSDERILLLDRLQGMEVNDKYKLETLFSPVIKVIEQREELEVQLVANHHAYKYDHNCYFTEILVLMWSNENDEITYEVQKSQWIPVKAPLPVKGSFIFKKPEGVTDYLVACKCSMGLNNKTEEMLPQQGMKIMVVGSYGEREKELLEIKKNTKKEINTKKEDEVEEVRVKMSFG